MQLHDLQSLYLQFQGALSDTTTSLCLYHSTDRAYFHPYPQRSFGLSTGSTFATVLPELRTRFAVQATGSIITAAIESATIMMQHEVEFGCGYSVRVVDNATQLASALGYYQALAFVRDDRCLVVWGDCVEDVMTSWSEVTFLLQSQFGSAPLPSNPMVGLSYGDNLSMDPFDLSSALQAEGSSQPSDDTLSFLNEFSFLATVPGPTTSSPTHAYSYLDSAWLLDQSESPGMEDLQLGLQTLDTSDSSHANEVSYNLGETPWTVNLASISPPPVGVFDLLQEEDPTMTTASPYRISLDFSTPASDDAVSSASFSRSPSAQQNSFALSPDAAGPLSFRRHSFGAPSDPPPRIVGKKTKRVGAIAVDDEFPTAAADAATHTSKRRRAAGGGQATSAPARFTVPLPDVEKNDCEDDDGSSSVSSSNSSNQSLALNTPLSTASASLFPSPSPAPPSRPAPASRRGRRRAGASSGGGRAGRVPRTPCEYCPKVFTRAQDAQRHAAMSCPLNPNREGVRCPECGEVLSRIDSAQRHWRKHENPQCETPTWAPAGA